MACFECNQSKCKRWALSEAPRHTNSEAQSSSSRGEQQRQRSGRGAARACARTSAPKKSSLISAAFPPALWLLLGPLMEPGPPLASLARRTASTHARCRGGVGGRGVSGSGWVRRYNAKRGRHLAARAVACSALQ